MPAPVNSPWRGQVYQRDAEEEPDGEWDEEAQQRAEAAINEQYEEEQIELGLRSPRIGYVGQNYEHFPGDGIPAIAYEPAMTMDQVAGVLQQAGFSV